MLCYISVVNRRGVATGVDIGIYTPQKNKISPSELFMG